MAFLVSVFRFKESESFLMAISNYFVYLFKALVFSSILVLGPATGIIFFIVFGFGTGLYPSMNYGGCGMMLSLYS